MSEWNKCPTCGHWDRSSFPPETATLLQQAEKAEAELAAAQAREAKLRELCKTGGWLYPYQVLRILDGKEGE